MRIALVSILLVGCKPDVPPGEVVQSYFDRIRKPDYRGAWDLLSTEDQRAQPLSAFEEQMRLMAPTASRPVEVERAEVTGDRAIVYYTTMIPNVDEASDAFIDKVVDVTMSGTGTPDLEKMKRFAELVLPMLHSAIEAGEVPLVKEGQKLELVIEAGAWRIRRTTDVPSGTPKGERFVDRALRRWAEKKGMPMLAP